jgi:predicted GNAT family acetyltransferase
MAAEVRLLDDPVSALAISHEFLRERPIEHNLILTLLEQRIADPTPGRYWIVSEGDQVIGVVFQSPLDFLATLTPMSDAAIRAAVEAIANAKITLPGVNGEVGTAARFAGHWTELTKSAATPHQGQRIYELRSLQPPEVNAGMLRPANGDDIDLLARWTSDFQSEGMPSITSRVLAARVEAGQFWLWHLDEPVSMAACSTVTEGVARVAAVYTPPELRQRGFASACVGQLSAHLVSEGHRCMLYTDLGNPVSNSIYRRLGYEAVSEVLRYSFAIGT